MSGNSDDPLIQIIEANKRGEQRGIYSICSAHPFVIEAAMGQARKDGSVVCIESTSNQVDQFGGYTGMTPAQFAQFVSNCAERCDFPLEKLILGGDHLGPNTWQDQDARTAMEHAETLVAEYVAAGYHKIHLDASMHCSDDPGDRDKPLADEIVAEREARLCEVAEKTWKQRGKTEQPPVYIIGTEVPVPGGSASGSGGEQEELTPTTVEEAATTIEVAHDVFTSSGLHDAWNRVIASVVQPGVEFGDDFVIHYDREKAKGLTRLIAGFEGMVFEAHSTDYQSMARLSQMVADHFCILKVGPQLTFAYREALFSLEAIEKELYARSSGVSLSRLRDTLEAVMLENPKHWQKYYHGDETEKRLKRRYSFSDRCRYYWSDKRLQEAVDTLLANLNQEIPANIISQFLPGQFSGVMYEGAPGDARSLLLAKVREVTETYARACGMSSV
jgi:D-tagatose-1,6-bisphosphate aldolase subunit GatZ/KbaZ